MLLIFCIFLPYLLHNCITKGRLVDYLSQYFGFSVCTANFPSRSFQFSIFSILSALFFISQTTSVWPQDFKPRAVVMGLNSASAPGFSEQILLQNLRNELARNFDLSRQSAFEIALHKMEQTAEQRSCLQLKCMLKAHSAFPQTSLFLLESRPDNHRLTLVMIGENQQWRVKHEDCILCGLTPEERLTNVVLRMESYVRPPMAVENTNPQPFSKSAALKSASMTADTPKAKSSAKKILPKPELSKSAVILKQKDKLPLEELQFKIAQRRYNKLIWKTIKKDLMFFRQKNRNRSIKNLKARLRLQIDKFGKVIERRLLTASGSENFDHSILNSVDLLKLPPPMELLIRHPPYVVTILIQP